MCTAPTVMVLAAKADTTPRARVNPKVRRGGSSDDRLARKANTVVTTARDRASRSTENDSTHALAALTERFLANS